MKLKKIVSLLLTMVLLLSMAPVFTLPALAATEEDPVIGMNNDTLDALAVYSPLYGTGNQTRCEPRLIIYDVTENCEATLKTSIRLPTGEEFISGESQTVVEKKWLNSNTPSNNEFRYYVPTVSLTSVKTGETRQRVAVTVNMPRYSDYKRKTEDLKRSVADSYSQLYVFYLNDNDALKVKGSYALRWNWNRDLGVSTTDDEDAAAKWEMMMFAGVDAGDMD